MASLRETMARNGFESNDDYEFQVRCLLHGPADGIRTLSIEGDGGRRKTAFATALAHSLERDHVLYHDFADASPAVPEVTLPASEDEYGRKEAPIEPLDDIVSHACALSEAESVVLILDQSRWQTSASTSAFTASSATAAGRWATPRSMPMGAICSCSSSARSPSTTPYSAPAFASGSTASPSAASSTARRSSA